MDCREVEDAGVVESYVSGQLAGAPREAFEAHFFECQECLDRLEACRLLRQGLSEDPSRPARRVPTLRVAGWSAGLAAAAALVAVVLWPHQLRSTAPERPAPARPAPTSLAELGRFDPPAYSGLVWRDAAGEPGRDVKEGMRLYQARDYRGAIAALRRAAADSAQSHFYLGICLLLTRQTDDGLASLAHVSALGDTPYLEPALFYLAKGNLTNGDRPEAERRLRQVIALHGDREPEARELLRQLSARRDERP